MTNATPVPRREVPPDVLDDVAELLRASRSERTWRAYESDLRAWCRWCDDHDVDPLPATGETLVWWLHHTRQHIVSLLRVVATDRTSFRETARVPPGHRYVRGKGWRAISWSWWVTTSSSCSTMRVAVTYS